MAHRAHHDAVAQRERADPTRCEEVFVRRGTHGAEQRTVLRVPTSSDAHGHHDWHSTEYVDGWIENDVTRDAGRRPVLRKVAELLPFEKDAAARVLDVGGGYGMLTREVLEEWPNSTVVLHDFSEPMFEQARARLGPLVDRVEFVRADLRDPPWADAVDGPFDAVVSSIAIHNVRDPDRVRAIRDEIRQLVERLVEREGSTRA